MVADSEKDKLLSGIAAKMSENVAYILTYLYCHKEGCTVAMTMADTKLEKNKTRLALLLLETTLCVEKQRQDRCWVYSITEIGQTVLRFLLDGTEYPGRKIKFRAMLQKSVEGFSLSKESAHGVQ